MSFLIETHYHTPETSWCCQTAPADVFSHYFDNGYTGIVITDHYFEEWFDRLRDMNWKQKIEQWLNGYKAAEKVGQKFGIKVILGMELRFARSSNDYMVYGVTEDLLFEHPELYKMTPRDFRDFADKHNLFFAQAHPFRTVCEPVAPELLHGVEIYNGNPRHNNRNNLAKDFACAHNLIMISGSDFHQIEDSCKGGIYLSKIPNDSRDLAALISSGCINDIKSTV